MRHILLPLLFVASTAQASDWNTRPGDELLDQSALTKALAGHVIEFFDGGRADYRADGGYGYTYKGGGTSMGRYEIGTDSAVCVTFDNGFSRCDMYVRASDRLVLITEDGLRFPVRGVE